jgi:hypothetical protein
MNALIFPVLFFFFFFSISLLFNAFFQWYDVDLPHLICHLGGESWCLPYRLKNYGEILKNLLVLSYALCAMQIIEIGICVI